MSKQKNKRTLNLWCPRAAESVLDSLPPALLLLEKIKLLIYLSHYVGVSTALLSCSVMSYSLWPHGLQPARPLHPWDSPGKNTGVGCHFLLQGIFPTQGSNTGLLHCRWILYHLSHQKSPRILLSLLLIVNTIPNSYAYYTLFPTRQIETFWKYESESHSVMSDSLWPHGLVHGILQARILEWVAFPFSRVSSQLRDRTQLSTIAGHSWALQPFTSWATREAQEYWSG